MLKNTSGQRWICFAFGRTSGSPVTGDAANITANLRIDGGSTKPVDDTNPTELSNGYYYFDISDVETNGNMLLLIPVSATANVIVIGCPGALWTEPAGQKYAATIAAADVSGNLPAAVNEQANIDFGALQKASLNAASVTVSDKTGFALATAPPTKEDIADAVCDEAIGTHAGFLAKVNALPASPAAVGSVMTLAAVPPTKEEISTKVWSETTRALTDKAGFAPTVVQIRQEIDSNSTQLIAIAASGSDPVGSVTWTYAVTNSVTHAAISGATVEAYSDVACTVLEKTAIPNSAGIATFRLVPGTYYILAFAPNYDEPIADAEVVT
jgi:hypothetical protein